MAEELAATTAEPGTETAPVEEVKTPEVVQEPAKELDRVESLAAEEGWVPKEQFTGNPDKWRPADEYLRVGKASIRNLAKELREAQSTLANVSRVSQTLMEQQLAERDAEWQRKMDEAFEAGDKAGFDAAAEARKKLTVPTRPSEPPEVQEFRQRNAWYETDPNATAYAVMLSNQNKSLPVPEQLRFVETEVRKRFPEHFPVPAKQPPAVNQPATRGAGKANGAKSFNDMPRAAQEMALHFEKERGIPKEKYTETYWNDQEKVR